MTVGDEVEAKYMIRNMAAPLAGAVPGAGAGTGTGGRGEGRMA